MHMIYENDQEKIIYNMEASKHTNDIKIKKP